MHLEEGEQSDRPSRVYPARARMGPCACETAAAFPPQLIRHVELFYPVVRIPWPVPVDTYRVFNGIK